MKNVQQQFPVFCYFINICSLKRRNEQKYVILLMLGITFPKDFPKRPLLILVFSQVATSQQCNFPKRQLPYCAISQVATSQLCNFPSGNFPSMQFPKLQLPNCAISQVATSQLCNFPKRQLPQTVLDAARGPQLHSAAQWGAA